ncbi:dihydrofolate reductase family protein [Streptomyces sp. bgisy031]|uniref:dihydrofolate reductase family protein n=1 Tax=Streptomyces sp. bgisy031 TaxID=3413772 RepID=UPI003D71F144
MYSRTPEHADRNTTIVRDVVVEDVLALEKQPGGNMALGGADLAASFLEHDLVDEFRVYVQPGAARGREAAVPGAGPQGPAPAGGEPEVRERGRAAALPARLGGCRAVTRTPDTGPPRPAGADRGGTRHTGVLPEVLRRATRWPG